MPSTGQKKDAPFSQISLAATGLADAADLFRSLKQDHGQGQRWQRWQKREEGLLICKVGTSDGVEKEPHLPAFYVCRQKQKSLRSIGITGGGMAELAYAADLKSAAEFCIPAKHLQTLELQDAWHPLQG